MDDHACCRKSTLDRSRLLNEHEAAAVLSISVHTLRRQRSERRGGVPFVRVGSRTVRYRREDIEAYVAGAVVDPRPGGAR